MVIIDQTGRLVNLETKPKRIVSLVPSMTELVLALVGADRVVGRTKFCIHPSSKVNQITKIGGTKNPRLADILSLKPDLILANKEENIQEHITELENSAPVYVSNVKSIEDNFDMIADIGQLVQNPTKAFEIMEATESIILNLKQKKNKSAAYLIWKEPFMVAGGDTFINTMLEAFGFKNIFKDESRYPQKTIEALSQANPDYIFLSSEPYPFEDNHVKELEAAGLKAKIILVDGAFFSWYGNRITKMRAYIPEFLSQL